MVTVIYFKKSMKGLRALIDNHDIHLYRIPKQANAALIVNRVRNVTAGITELSTNLNNPISKNLGFNKN